MPRDVDTAARGDCEGVLVVVDAAVIEEARVLCASGVGVHPLVRERLNVRVRAIGPGAS